jgi:hypothetical protein
MKVLACDKSGYFEMYKQAQTGTAVSEICLDSTCMNRNNFERSGSFPICSGTAQPDLMVASVSGPSSASTGQAISIQTTLANQGKATPPTFRTALYLSTDAAITSADTLIGTFDSPPLYPNSTTTTTRSVGLPPNTQGTYYLGAITDSTNVVSESNENNNAAVGNQIVIGGTASPGTSLVDGLLAYYKLDGNLNDIPGGHNARIARPTVSFTSGKINQGLQFTPAQPEGAAINATLYVDTTAQLSIGFWAQASSSGSMWAWPARYELIRLSDGRVQLRSFEQYGSTIHTVTTNPISDGEWHYYTIIIDRTYPQKSAWLYVDGAAIGSVKDADENTHGTMWWGGPGQEWYSYLMTQQGFSGAIDEIGVWKRLLAPSEITQLYNGGAGTSYSFGVSVPVYSTCYAEMQSIPATCNSGTVTEDTLSGDTCRYITCTNGASATTVKVCNKPGKYDPQYFEMYRTNQTGTALNICLQGTCAGVNSFARSSTYPLCS